MMKSEAQKDVKRRLVNLFGEYSDFVVRPNQQQTTDREIPNQNDAETTVPGSNDVGSNNEQGSGERDVAIDRQISSNLNSMLGQLVNIERPLSPVNNVITTPQTASTSMNLKTEGEKTGEAQKTSQNGKNKNKSLDLKTMLEQFSQVTPLISPIHLDHFDDLAANHTKDEEKAKGKPEIKRKRRNSSDVCSSEEKRNKTEVILSAENSQMNIRSAASGYSIKLCERTFNNLLKKLANSNGQSSQQQSKDVKMPVVCRNATPSSSNSSVNTVPETASILSTSESTMSKMAVPTKVSFPVPVKKSPSEYYQSSARDIKKRGEQHNDRVHQVLLYFESIAYHIVASSTLDAKPEKMHSSIAETSNWLNSSWSTFKRHKFPETGPQTSIRTCLKYLQMMISACLAYNLYSTRSSQAISTYSLLTQYEKENPNVGKRSVSRTNGIGNESVGSSTNGAATSTTTPSPSDSTPGSLSSQAMVSIPMDFYNSMSQQIRTLHHLMWSCKLWKDAQKYPKECKEFFDILNKLCGDLKQDANLIILAEYLLNAVNTLRQQYATELAKM